MAGPEFILALAILCQAAASDLRPISISAVEHGQGRQYTIRYNATSQATIQWGNSEWKFYFGPSVEDIEITSSFSEGQGESTLTRPIPEKGLTLWLLSNDTFFYYLFEEFVGLRQLPVTEIISPAGNTIAYTPGEPFRASILYSHLPSEYISQSLFWFFNYIDHFRLEPILETATADHGDYSRYARNVSTVVKGQYYEVSAELNLESQEGIATILTSYARTDPNMQIYSGAMVAIKQEDHEGPFPDDFIGVSISVTGFDEIFCYNSTCRAVCDAFGPDVDYVEMRRIGSETPLEPLYMFQNKWFSTSEYQFTIDTNSTDVYVCKARNTNNRWVQKEARVHNSF